MGAKHNFQTVFGNFFFHLVCQGESKVDSDITVSLGSGQLHLHSNLRYNLKKSIVLNTEIDVVVWLPLGS